LKENDQAGHEKINANNCHLYLFGRRLTDKFSG
jgi:hypothetical protein